MSNENFSQDGNSLKLDGNIIYTPRLTKGEPGEQGVKGEKGDKGDPFTYEDLTPGLIQNLKGERGLKGEEGLLGKLGPQGEKGDRGLPGDKGLKGDKGDKGERGDRGSSIIPHIIARATVDSSVGLPHVDVSVGGSDEAPILEFNFKGLRGQAGADGTNGKDAEPYNPTQLILLVERLIASEEQRIRDLIESLDREIKEDVIRMVDESEFWQEHLPEDVIGGNSNFGKSDVREYLQELGIWKNSDGATYTNWSTIKLTVNNIRTEVNQLKLTGIDYESLSSSLYNYISDNQALSGMLSTWAKFLKLSDDDIQMLEWMSSGIKSSAGGNAGNLQAITELFASAKNAQTAMESYAGLNAKVEEINGRYVSTANLTSYVNNAISSSMSGVITEATLEEAMSTMYARLNDKISGFITRSNLNETVAEMFAEEGNLRSSISAYINEQVSKIDLNADEINVVSNGKVVAQIKNNGRCSFNEDRVFIPTVVRGMNGNLDNNASGLIIKEVLDGLTTSTCAYYQGNGFNVQGNGMYGSINCGSNRILELNSYLSSTNNYALKLTFAINCKDPSTNAPRILAHVASDLESTVGSKGTFETNMNLIVKNNINYTGTCSELSDETVKNIINNINLSIEDIANTRIVNYRFKFDPRHTHSGTIALDWLDILPNVVTTNPEDGTLGLDYGATGLISSVTAAREIVKLKLENERLKQRLAIIEQLLNL